nr:hypothetical protein [Tanacetum cinerariifolium]
GQTGKAFGDLHPDLLLADFHQRGAELHARAVEQLHRIAFGHAQYPTDVMRLGFGQFVFTEAQGGVDEKAGESHGCFSVNSS